MNRYRLSSAVKIHARFALRRCRADKSYCVNRRLNADILTKNFLQTGTRIIRIPKNEEHVSEDEYKLYFFSSSHSLDCDQSTHSLPMPTFSNRELNTRAFLRRGRQPEVSCFPF